MIIKRRKIRLHAPASAEKIEQLLSEISRDDPAARIQSGENPRILVLEYDLLRQTWKDIRQSLLQNGLKLSNSILQRLRSAIWSYTEENERDNAHARPAPCCSNPEKILSKGKA